MSDMAEPGIVVGVSGSYASVRALRWAGAVAQRRGLPLRAVLAWEPGQFAGYAPVARNPECGGQERAAQARLAAALKSAFGPSVPPGLVAEVAEGSAERVLVEVSAGAELLVLGSSAERHRDAASIGPVIRGCLSGAHSPVAVIGSGAAGDLEPGRPARAAHVLTA
jgi:nucleotide-binding universal stress UspA family protein